MASNSSQGLVKLEYGIEDRPPLGLSMVFGFQHVLVMFSAMIGEPLIIAGILKLPMDVTAILISASMIACGLGTIFQAKGFGFVGSRLPLVMGSFYIFISPIVAIATTAVSGNVIAGLGAAFTATMFGGLINVFIAPWFGKLKKFFPPIVTGTVVTIIGLSLIPIGLAQAVGANTPIYGKPSAIIIGAVTILSIIIINRISQGFIKTISILLALAVGYVVAALFGVLDLSGLAAAPWFKIPKIMPFGFVWPGFSAILVVCISFLVAAMECTGATLAVASIVGVNADEKRLGGSIAADGLASSIGAVLGGSPLTSYSQNTGLITLTGVGSRYVVFVGGVILLILGFIPKFAALIAAMPGPVLGGALVIMFGMVTSIGVTIIRNSITKERNLLIFATSISLGLGLSTLPGDALNALPQTLRLILSSGMTVGAFTAVFMNLLIPGREDEVDKAEDKSVDTPMAI